MKCLHTWIDLSIYLSIQWYPSFIRKSGTWMLHLFGFELFWAYARGLSGKSRPSQDFGSEIYEPGRWDGSGHIYYIGESQTHLIILPRIRGHFSNKSHWSQWWIALDEFVILWNECEILIRHALKPPYKLHPSGSIDIIHQTWIVMTNLKLSLPEHREDNYSN